MTLAAVRIASCLECNDMNKLTVWNVCIITANNLVDFVERKGFTWLVKEVMPVPWNELLPHLGSCAPLSQQSEPILV